MQAASSALSAPVENIMSRAVVQMFEGIPMSEARALAVKYDYNGFPVVARDGQLLGMLTKGDLLRVARAAVADPGVWKDPVARWMAHGVLALRPQDALQTAIEHLVERRLRSLPVIDQESRVVGMVSRNDLVTAIS